MNEVPELRYLEFPPFGVAPLPIFAHMVPSGRNDHPGNSGVPSGVFSDIEPFQRFPHPTL